MKKKRAYTKAMAESIRNTGMWLKEAKIIAKKGSKSHAQALLILADEELGKAALCWLVVNGVMPFNHPEADFRSRKGTFKSHPLKLAATHSLTLAVLFPDEVDTDETAIDPFTNERKELRDILGQIGGFTAEARKRWIYVDIIEKLNQLSVWSPLNQEPRSAESAIKQLETTLISFKSIVRKSSSMPEMRKAFKDMREYLERHDDTFPPNPEWN